MLNSAGRYEIESDEEQPMHPLPAIQETEQQQKVGKTKKQEDAMREPKTKTSDKQE